MSCGTNMCGIQQGGNSHIVASSAHGQTYASISKMVGGALESCLPTQAKPEGGAYTVIPKIGGKHRKQSHRTKQSKRSNYKPTSKNLKYLAKWKRGESIGFTMRSSLKAKGLIPRANGTRRVSNKYKTPSTSRSRSHKIYSPPLVQRYTGNTLQTPYQQSPMHVSSKIIGGK